MSLLWVTLFHIKGYFLAKSNITFADDPDSYFFLNCFFSNGDRAVQLFFAISGFILCVPFANHYLNGTKKINLKPYYLRRVTRLEPPYFIVMICIFLAQLVLHVHTFDVLFPSLLASLIYSHNLIFHTTPLVTVVAWTLEIEIQYYIIAPLMFRILKLSRIIRRLLLVGLIALFVVLQHMYPPAFLSLYGMIQHFLIGILIADFYVSGFATDFFAKKQVALLGAGLFLALFLIPDRETFGATERLLYELFFPFLLALFFYTVLKNDIVKKVFSYKFVPIIGGMCYTTYLIHYTVISMMGALTTKIKITDYYVPNLLFQVAILLTLIMMVASVFFLYVERPFMSKKWVEKLMKK